MAVALAMREQGSEGNDLLDRLAADARLGLDRRRRSTGALAEPLDFVGHAAGRRSPRFVATVGAARPPAHPEAAGLPSGSRSCELDRTVSSTPRDVP